MFLAPLGFLCAVVAAAVTMAVSLFGFDNQAEFLLPFFVTVGVTTFWTATVTVLPAAIAIALAEAFAWRSILYFFLAGGVIALIADQVSGLAIEPTIPGQRLAIMLASGFVGGFVYWVIAGRRAGDWGNVANQSVPARRS